MLQNLLLDKGVCLCPSSKVPELTPVEMVEVVRNVVEGSNSFMLSVGTKYLSVYVEYYCNALNEVKIVVSRKGV